MLDLGRLRLCLCFGRDKQFFAGASVLLSYSLLAGLLGVFYLGWIEFPDSRISHLDTTKSAAQLCGNCVGKAAKSACMVAPLEAVVCWNTDLSCSRGSAGLFTGRWGGEVQGGGAATLNHSVTLKYARPRWPWTHACWQNYLLSSSLFFGRSWPRPPLKINPPTPANPLFPASSSLKSDFTSALFHLIHKSRLCYSLRPSNPNLSIPSPIENDGTLARLYRGCTRGLWGGF